MNRHREWFRVSRWSLSCVRCGGTSYSMGRGLMHCEVCGVMWWRDAGRKSVLVVGAEREPGRDGRATVSRT